MISSRRTWTLAVKLTIAFTTPAEWKDYLIFALCYIDIPPAWNMVMVDTTGRFAFVRRVARCVLHAASKCRYVCATVTAQRCQNRLCCANLDWSFLPTPELLPFRQVCAKNFTKAFAAVAGMLPTDPFWAYGHQSSPWSHAQSTRQFNGPNILEATLPWRPSACHHVTFSASSVSSDKSYCVVQSQPNILVATVQHS